MKKTSDFPGNVLLEVVHHGTHTVGLANITLHDDIDRPVNRCFRCFDNNKFRTVRSQEVRQQCKPKPCCSCLQGDAGAVCVQTDLTPCRSRVQRLVEKRLMQVRIANEPALLPSLA